MEYNLVFGDKENSKKDTRKQRSHNRIKPCPSEYHSRRISFISICNIYFIQPTDKCFMLINSHKPYYENHLGMQKGWGFQDSLVTCHLSCEHIDWHIGKFPMSPKQPLLDVEKISKLDLGFDVVSCCLLKPSIRSISQFFRMIPCLKSAGLKDYEIYESSWHPLVIYELDKKKSQGARTHHD